MQDVDTDQEKRIIKQMMTSFYVDNCVTSVDSTEELHQFMKVAKLIMAKASFDLRGWEYSGQKEIEASTSVLGLQWNKIEDTLGVALSSLRPHTNSQITKRIILSAAQRVFDPIGVASPVFLKPKLLLQRLWSSKISWDDAVPEDVEIDFKEWQQHLHWLEGLHIPRQAFHYNEEVSNLSFHVFVDASQDAYAAVLFARTGESETIYVQLIEAKSRVAPIVRATIPRLELLAATIGARLWHTVKNAANFHGAKVFFWKLTPLLFWRRFIETNHGILLFLIE